MCGRFTRHCPTTSFADLFDAEVRDELPPSYNVAPSQPVLAAREAAGGGRELVALRWGLIPNWSEGPDKRYSMINARAETVAQKPAYRAAFKQRRCLLAADGFYEWQRNGRQKQPFYLRLNGGQPFAMAALWERWHGPEEQVIESCAVITTDANAKTAEIHERMPVILDPADYESWLQSDDAAILQALLRPFPAERMETYPVSTRVNSPKNNDAACAERLSKLPLIAE